MLVWRLTLYQKREAIALFICKLPKIKVFNKKIGSKFDTTASRKGVKKMVIADWKYREVFNR